MSVRIYQLSKETGLDNQELINILKERGYNVKSASSTIDNISAESLVEEFGSKKQEADKEPTVKEVETVKPKPRGPVLPKGVFVKSKAEVDRERREREEAKRSAFPVKFPPKPGVMPAPRIPRPPAPGGGRVGTPPRLGVPPSRPGTMGKGPILREPGAPSEPPPATPPKVTIPRVVEKPARKESAKPAKVSPPAVSPPSVSPPPASPPVVSAPPQKSAPPTPPPVEIPKPAGAAPRVTAPPSARIPDSGAEAVDKASEEPKEAKVLQLKPPIVVRDFAALVGLKPFRLISELMDLGIFASMNQLIEEDVAQKIAEKHGFILEVRHRGEGQPEKEKKPKKKPKVDESKLLEPRPPVVCILGHVDHGKTTLLDTIRDTRVVDGEAGGITQHVGAYQVQHEKQKITFIDTPGHAAFSNMRARGANITDIAILIVAADDGFMPQTDEALGHARIAGVPVIVAINKIDARGANVDRVKQQMQERDLASEDWGGETLCVPISALKGENIDELLENILLQAEMMDTLKANPKCPAEGTILETQKEVGRGSTASVIVQKGTLKVGDALVCGPFSCKVRAILNDQGKKIKNATPSTPVKIVGWSGTPDSGNKFETVKNDRTAKQMASDNEHQLKVAASRAHEEQDSKPNSLEDLFAAIASTKKKSFRVVVKADVYGTAEALATSLENIESDKIDLEVVQLGVGAISRSDVLMASAANASIVGFNINLENGVTAFAKHHKIPIFQHNIIYELINQIRDAMADELDPELREVKLGAAQVRMVFSIAKGQVAGCMVTEGKIVRDAKARLLRKNDQLWESKVETLKRFKDDATEVRSGYECGIRLDNYDNYEEGDVIECFQIQKIRPAL